MFFRKPQPPEETTTPPFEFRCRGTRVIFAPEDLAIEILDNVKVFIDGEQVHLDREESMCFLREYVNWLDNL